MTFKDHPTDMMDNPDGRDYHYRFRANDEEAWKFLKFARWKGRMIEMYPKDMKHLRTKIDHVTFKTYDKMGYIKSMKQYATSPSWQKVPHSRGKMEMRNANGGGSKIRAEEYTGEKWGTVNVEFHIDATPSEVTDAFENGVNEDSIHSEIQSSKHWAVEDKIDELRERLAEAQRECSHEHVIDEGFGATEAYCEDCGMEWVDSHEFEADVEANNVTVVA